MERAQAGSRCRHTGPCERCASSADQCERKKERPTPVARRAADQCAPCRRRRRRRRRPHCAAPRSHAAPPPLAWCHACWRRRQCCPRVRGHPAAQGVEHALACVPGAHVWQRTCFSLAVCVPAGEESEGAQALCSCRGGAPRTRAALLQACRATAAPRGPLTQPRAHVTAGDRAAAAQPAASSLSLGSVGGGGGGAALSAGLPLLTQYPGLFQVRVWVVQAGLG
jgi:hypothetical protein